ncbi:MAG: cyclic-di-AMP receptor [Defluviitaleaceae bacterium]|nr:cyclic-di-AMP receptor [Defluviitaleaceae bacterium]
MKMVVAIIHDEDVFHISDLLIEKKFYVTKIASTGGFLKAGFTTIMTGVDDDRVEELIETIESKSKSRKKITTVNETISIATEAHVPFPVEVTINGATIFVLQVDQFIKV